MSRAFLYEVQVELRVKLGLYVIDTNQSEISLRTSNAGSPVPDLIEIHSVVLEMGHAIGWTDTYKTSPLCVHFIRYVQITRIN
jgi:hypothetical protein